MATPTLRPAGIVVGHLGWQGFPQPASRNALVSGRLTVCAGGTPQSFTFQADDSGIFTLTTGLTDGVYNWLAKGEKHLSSSSPSDGTSLSLIHGYAYYEFPTQRTGDTNYDNVVNATDFSNLRTLFGQTGNSASDFNFDQTVNSADFSLLRGSFGQRGHTLTCP